MSRPVRIRRIVGVSALAVLGTIAAVVPASAQAGPTDPTTPAPPSSTAPAPVKKTVDTGDNFFKPKKVTVTVGSTITWENTGRNVHNVVPNKGKKFGTSSLRPGKTYKFTFKKPGTYKYYCSFHGAPNSGQHGTIVVTG
jgi:plastocyanin